MEAAARIAPRPTPTGNSGRGLLILVWFMHFARVRRGRVHWTNVKNHRRSCDINAGNSWQKYYLDNFDPRSLREFHRHGLTAGRKARAREQECFEVGREWDLPVVGTKAYMSGPTPVHSLSLRLPAGRRARLRMGFGRSLHQCLHRGPANLGPIVTNSPWSAPEGLEVVPLARFVKAVLPTRRPSRADYTGKTVIGDLSKATRTAKM